MNFWLEQCLNIDPSQTDQRHKRAGVSEEPVPQRGRPATLARRAVLLVAAQPHRGLHQPLHHHRAR